ncbi:MAG: oligopeptide/dipeptide ABC transporter ATP-binding protein [Armatimonadota bacterium]
MIRLERVSRAFASRGGIVRVVDEVSLEIDQGEVLCLVGESGSGKTTLGKMIAGLTPPSEGRIFFEGADIGVLRGDAWRAYRRAVQIVHQDPYASLNPTKTVFEILAAPLRLHGVASAGEVRAQAAGLLGRVELAPPGAFLDKFPHQLSGGQRQRVSLARALSVEPRFLVADEPVSMIDVSLRVSLLNLLARLRSETGVGCLFITHDLAVARYIGAEGRTAVMYLGRLVELGPTAAVVERAQHPYTRALLAAVPEADPRITRAKARMRLRGDDTPDALGMPAGCAFHPRCPWFEPGLCDAVRPDLVPIGSQVAACLVAARDGGLRARSLAE